MTKFDSVSLFVENRLSERVIEATETKDEVESDEDDSSRSQMASWLTSLSLALLFNIGNLPHV